MFHLRRRLIQVLLFCLDVGIAALAFWAAHWIRFRLEDPAFPAMGSFHEHFSYLTVILPVWAAILLCSPSLYRMDPTRKFRDELWSLILTCAFAGAVVFALAFGLKWKFLSRTLISLFVALDCGLMIAVRIALGVVFRRLERRGYSFCSVLIVGASDRARAFAARVERYKHWGLTINGLVFLEPEPKSTGYSSWSLLGSIEDIPKLLKNHVVDEVIFVSSEMDLKIIPSLLSTCDYEGVKLRVVADFLPNRKSARVSLALLDSVPLFTFSHAPDEAVFLVAKRVIDLLGSLAAIVLFAPLMLLVAVGIKMTSPGPVFYRQERCGLRGRRFRVLKFRSMVTNAEQMMDELRSRNEMDGPVFKLRNDPRVTPFGRLLRKTSIDELPQFFNVLMGHMSLVGPRPSLPSEVKDYDDRHRRRLSVKPGITCLWQISGRNELGFRRWMELDLEYIDNCSLWMDMKILAKTIPAVLSGRGAS